VRSKKLLVCDLDNTLYDWVGYFVPAFYAMVDQVVSITGCDKEKLLDEFRGVHQKYADAEHPFALLETETIAKRFRTEPLHALKDLDPAFHAFNSERKRHLKLHEGVLETLSALKAEGVQLVAHTESKLFGVVDRLTRFDLFQYFHHVYCRERSETPHPKRDPNAWLTRVPPNVIVELSGHQAKPDPAVLLEICAREGFAANETAYVGDSVARDILMAKKASVFAIWAAYGAQHDPIQYEKLVRISHWTSAEVEKERQLKAEAKSLQPDFVAKKSFREVLQALKIASPLRAVAR
jgi:phosphoglycolate phosphatase